MFTQAFRGLLAPSLMVSAVLLTFGDSPRALYAQQGGAKASIIREIQNPNERLELTVNSGRRLTLKQKVREAQVNNPELLDLTALSPNEFSVHAKKAGVTQIILWGEQKQIYTIDVIIFGDAEELTLLLRSEFPKANIKVIPVANAALISGYVDQPEQVSRIMEIAGEFYPKVISNLTVGGVQQVLLHVKVMEVSRTKLRSLGFDWAKVTGGNVIVSGVSGLISGVAGGATPSASAGADSTFSFQIIEGTSAFFGVLEALRQDNLMKVLAEPTLVTVSGRPAFFNVGGEFPILVPESLGTVSIEYKKFGTQVDFVPIVLGNGKIRLEVRPRVSEVDPTRSVEINSFTVPGLRVREVDTGVEMSSGQTLAIAGLVQDRVEAQRRGLPWIGEVPYLGSMFRSVQEQKNEIELLIMVTPELVDAMDAHEVPRCGPGTRTDSPNDWQLFMRGHIEVPRCCPGGAGDGCAECDGQVPQAIPAGTDNPRLPGMIVPQPPKEAPVGSSSRVRSPQTMQVVRKGPLASPRYSRSRGPNPPAAQTPTRTGALPGFIGPVGYDDVK